MDLYIAIFVFAVSTTVTPGPNNIMIMTSGLNFGLQRSLPHLMGICLGFPLMVAGVGIGFGVVFEKFPMAHEIIKILGVLYLLYLAYLVATSAPKSLEASDKETSDRDASNKDKHQEKTKPLTFLQAALFQWVNPKAWVMATGAVAAYTTQDAGMLLQVLLIAGAFLIASMPCVGIWLVCGTWLKRFLKEVRYQRAFNMTMALLLVVSILPVINELKETYLV
jgi:threonine/homoserine/homoserine lactone efflux protein